MPFWRVHANIYEDARLINVTVGELRLGNVNQIHDEILKKLESMAHARRRDTKIGRYPIPYCCELETLQQMYTAEELQTAGVTTALHSGQPPERETSQLGIGGERHHRL